MKHSSAITVLPVCGYCSTPMTRPRPDQSSPSLRSTGPQQLALHHRQRRAAVRKTWTCRRHGLRRRIGSDGAVNVVGLVAIGRLRRSGGLTNVLRGGDIIQIAALAPHFTQSVMVRADIREFRAPARKENRHHPVRFGHRLCSQTLRGATQSKGRKHAANGWLPGSGGRPSHGDPLMARCSRRRILSVCSRRAFANWCRQKTCALWAADLSPRHRRRTISRRNHRDVGRALDQVDRRSNQIRRSPMKSSLNVSIGKIPRHYRRGSIAPKLQLRD